MISLSALRRCIDGLQEGPNRRTRRRRQRRRRGNGRGNGAATPGTSFATPTVAPMPQRPPRAPRRGRAVNAGIAQGEVTLTRSERVQDITKSGSGTLVVHPTNFGWLSNISKAFDMYRWLKMKIEYRPVVGATKDGATAVGMDWSSQDAKLVNGKLVGKLQAVTRDSALACTPCFDAPVWQRVSLDLPPGKLRQKLWYDLTKSTEHDEFPGALQFITTSTAENVGELWAHYTVTLAGTRKV